MPTPKCNVAVTFSVGDNDLIQEAARAKQQGASTYIREAAITKARHDLKKPAGG